MIPESAGTTPYGVFLLADDFLEGAQRTFGGRISSDNSPARLLAYHAIELFLKTFLRSHGEEVTKLRSYNHDLTGMLGAAIAYGLSPSSKVVDRLRQVEDNNDYVRCRYVVSRATSDMRPETVVALAQDIRECVRLALNLNEFGAPLGEHWAAPEPADFVAAGRKPSSSK